MKKLLLLILIGLLVVLSVFIALNGFKLGNVEVFSYKGIQKSNKELDEKIQESSKLAQKDYKEAVAMLEESSKKLEQTKKEYEDMTVIGSDGEVQVLGQIERYELEALWVKLGNYATSEGAVLKIDILQGATSNTYNLNFAVNGSYISIIDFISDIENDSTLGFKIEQFKMLPDGNNLQATFTCREIAIKEVSQTSKVEAQNQTNSNQTTNTTKANNTTSTSNNTNNTNTR